MCAWCRYWVASSGPNYLAPRPDSPFGEVHMFGYMGGECHRRAPTSDAIRITEHCVPVSLWPRTAGDSSCGEFESKHE